MILREARAHPGSRAGLGWLTPVTRTYGVGQTEPGCAHLPRRAVHSGLSPAPGTAAALRHGAGARHSPSCEDSRADPGSSSQPWGWDGHGPSTRTAVQTRAADITSPLTQQDCRVQPETLPLRASSCSAPSEDPPQ